MNNEFTIEVCSDLDFEEMVTDVSYGGGRIAMVTQEKGINNMEIEFFIPSSQAVINKFPLDAFMDAIASAKNILVRMQKTGINPVSTSDPAFF